MTEAQKKKAHREEMARKAAEERAAQRAREEERKFQEDYTEFMKTREAYNDRAFQLFVTRKRKEKEAFEEEKKRQKEVNQRRNDAYAKLEKIAAKEKIEKAKKKAIAEKESDLQDYINSAQEKSTDISKEMTKILKKNTSEMFKSTEIIDDNNVRLRKQNREKIINELKSGNLTDEQVKNKQLELNYLNAVGDIQTDLIKKTNEGTIAEKSKDDIRKDILEKMGLTLEAYDKMSDAEKEAAGLILAGANRVEDAAEKISKATVTLSTDSFQTLLEEVKTLDNEFDQLIDKGKKYGAILKDSVARSVALRAAVVGVAASFAKDVFDSAKDVRQELGLSTVESAKFGFQITRNAKLLGILGGNAEEVKNFSVAIAKEFGNIGNLTDDVLKQFVDISAATGLTGENAAKLVNSIMSIQGGTLETSLNTIKVFENLARAEGVSSKLVLEDVAEDAELFATYAKEGGKNLAEAALQSRKLGISLSTVSQMAEKLLEFESSIESQMEAQVILGRSLNLDKARELALMGNLEGLQAEVLKQVGSQAEFEAMLPIQRKALADAIGTSVADLGRMVRGEDTSAQLAEKRAAAEEKRGETQMQIMKSMELMTMIMVGQQAISASMLLIEQLKKAQMISQQKIGVRNAFIKSREAGASMASALAQAAKAVFSNPLLAVASLAALGGVIAGVNRLMKPKESIEDGFIDSEGNVISKPKGSINIDSDDDIIVGSDLFGGNRNKIEQPNVADIVKSDLFDGILNEIEQPNVDNSVVEPVREQQSAVVNTITTPIREVTETNVNLDLGDIELKMDSQIKEAKQMNQNTKKLLEQNQFLMTKLIRTTGGLKGDA